MRSPFYPVPPGSTPMVFLLSELLHDLCALLPLLRPLRRGHSAAAQHQVALDLAVTPEVTPKPCRNPPKTLEHEGLTLKKWRKTHGNLTPKSGAWNFGAFPSFVGGLLPIPQSTQFGLPWLHPPQHPRGLRPGRHRKRRGKRRFGRDAEAVDSARLAMDGWMDVDRCVNDPSICLYACMDRWIDGSMDGWMNEGWIDGWMDVLIYIYMLSYDDNKLDVDR